jgi:hypothetical protein
MGIHPGCRAIPEGAPLVTDTAHIPDLDLAFGPPEREGKSFVLENKARTCSRRVAIRGGTGSRSRSASSTYVATRRMRRRTFYVPLPAGSTWDGSATFASSADACSGPCGLGYATLRALISRHPSYRSSATPLGPAASACWRTAPARHSPAPTDAPSGTAVDQAIGPGRPKSVGAPRLPAPVRAAFFSAVVVWLQF